MNININMTSTIQQAISENNAGTRLLRHCHYEAAVTSFTAVLQLLKPVAAIVENKQVRSCGDHKNAIPTDAAKTTANASSSSSIPLKISFHHKSMDTTDQYSSNYDTTTTTRTTHLHPSSSTPRATSTASSPARDAPSTTTDKRAPRKLKHFVFRDPVVISPHSIPAVAAAAEDASASASVCYSPAYFSKFLMIVMYNLALTLNLQALALLSSSSSSSSSSNKTLKTVKKLFTRSRKLYEIAFELHLETEIDTLFTLALTNNLGLIYRLCNERVRSTTCFSTMFSTMMYLMDSGSHESILSHSMKEWDGLLSNAIDILFKHTYEVAAAAA